MVSHAAGALALLAPLLAIFFPGRGRSLLAATLLSLLSSLFIAWQLAAGHVFTLELYTWASTAALDVNIGMAVRPLAIALLVLFHSAVLLLVCYADPFRLEASPSCFSIAAGVLLAVNMAVLGAGEIEFMLAWVLLGLSSIGFDHEHWYAGSTRWLERFGDVVLVAAMALSMLGFADWTALLFPIAAWVRIGHLPFPLEPRRLPVRHGWTQTLVDDLATPTVAVLLLLRYRGLYVGDVLLYAGLATALCAGLSALKAEDVRRVLSYSTVGQIALVLVALGVGSETAAVFLLVLHGAAKTLARAAVDSLARIAGGDWHRDRLGHLRLCVPISSAAFAFALVLLGLAPGLAGLWLWNELHTIWQQGLWLGAAFLGALQNFAILRRFFTAPHAKRPQAFYVLPPLSRTALWAMMALALGAALAVPFSPANWMVVFGLSVEPIAESLLPLLLAPLGATILGALLAWGIFSTAGKRENNKTDTSAFSTLLAEGFYLPSFYGIVVAQPLLKWATWWRDVDTLLVEFGLIRGGALAVRGLGFVLLGAQNGRVRTYAVVVLSGALALLLVLVNR